MSDHGTDFFGSLPERRGGSKAKSLDALLAHSPRRHVLREKLIKKFDYSEDAAIEAVYHDPYGVVLAIPGAGWMSADAVGRATGIALNDPARISAAIVETMRQEETWGHCWHVPKRLAEMVDKLCGCGRQDAGTELQRAADRGIVYAESADRIWFPKLYRAEESLADALAALRACPSARFRGAFSEPVNLNEPSTWGALQEDQAEALHAATYSPLVVIHGPPGSGKTFMLKEVLRRFSGSVELMAPTGRAAKRMNESIDRRDAKTIHRALQCRPTGDGGWRFTRERVDVDLLVVDETSMLSLSLARDLFTRVTPGTRVLLIGDPHQLPAVGPGDVLRDIIRSGAVTVTELRSIKRQDDAAIVRACSDVLDGKMPRLPAPGETDLAFMPARTAQEAADIARKILKSTGNRAKYGGEDDIAGIQVITPRRRKGSPVSCTDFSAAVWRDLHPGEGDKPYLAPGDKVMQTKNDYSLEVMNGDVGRVAENDGVNVTVEIDGEPVTAKESDWTIEHAWATTIHKYQGSEAPIVVLLMHEDAGPMLLTRQLFYTGLSRARNLCVIVGTRGAIERAVKNDREEKRRTGLAERLREVASRGVKR